MICSWEKVESVQLEYKYSVGEYLTYYQIQIMERHDAKTHLDEMMEYIQMNYTEEINEINHEKYKKILRLKKIYHCAPIIIKGDNQMVGLRL
jgi:hypothetical protein